MKLALCFILLSVLSSCSHQRQEEEERQCWQDLQWRRIDPADCDSDPDPVI